MAEPVPCEVGLQVPRCDTTEVPPQSLLRKASASYRPDPSGPVPTARSRTGGRTCYARPRAPVPEHSAQVQRCVHDRLFERQECSSDPSGTSEGATDDGAALLGRLVTA